MANQTRHILMVASQQPTEALRMASGLTLLDDQVQVAVLGRLDSNEATAEQLEALDFAEVTVAQLDSETRADALAEFLLNADVVYCV